MRSRELYPIWWYLGALFGVPTALAGLLLALLVATEVGELPFDNPKLVWLFGVLPITSLIALYGRWRRRQAMTAFASTELAPLLARRMSPSRSAIRAGLIICAMFLLVCALIGPRWGQYLEKTTISGTDVVVAIDVSRSMLAADVKPNRLQRTKELIRQQLTERPVFRRMNRLGLLAFAGTTSLKMPLSTDHLAFRNRVEQINLSSAPRGGTAIAHAIDTATDLFSRSPEEATKILLLFTDGEDHEGDPVAAAQAANKEHGIRVYTIGVGDPSLTAGAEVPSSEQPGARPLVHNGQIVFSRLDVDGLSRIADAGGGHFATIEELPQLVDAIAAIQPVSLGTEERLRYRPRYQWFLAGAMILLAIESLMRGGTARDTGLPPRLWQEGATTA